MWLLSSVIIKSSNWKPPITLKKKWSLTTKIAVNWNNPIRWRRPGTLLELIAFFVIFLQIQKSKTIKIVIVFFSLDALVTENQILNTKVSQSFLILFQSKKKRGQTVLFLNLIYPNASTDICCLLFAICFLVTSWSNEMKWNEMRFFFQVFKE